MDPTPRPATATTDPPPSWIGRTLGDRYEIEAELGEGGIGVVYRARDRQSGQTVALKMLRETFAQTRLQRRFAREAKALSALRHPNIVSILDVDVADDTPYLVMELLEGQTLSELMHVTRPLPIDRACEIMRELLAALTYVHGQGLVHRDLKPGNIFLQTLPEGGTRVKLLDFGLAKFLDGEGAMEQATVTRSGDIFGTLGYMPPEQAVGDVTDARADVYGAGAVLFEMLAGRRPFVGDATDLLQRQLTGEAPSLIEACPERIATPELDALLKRAMASKPSDRFADAAALSAAFDALPAPPARAPTYEELAAVSASDKPAGQAEPIGLAPTVFHDSAARLRKATKSGPVARFIQDVKDLGRAILLAGAWVLSAIVLFLVLVAVAVIYILFGSDHAQQQQALRDAMPSTIQKVLPNAPDAAVMAALPPGKPARPTAPAATSPTPSQAPATAPVAEPSSAPQAVIEAVAPQPGAEPNVAEADPPIAEGAEPAAVLVANSAPRVPAENPWRGAIPSTLKKLRAHAQKGWRGDERAIGWLRRYNREQPSDPRGHLVLGTLFMNREWYSDAANQYAFAYQKRPASRGDQAMLRNLIKVAGLEPTHERGSSLLITIYGSEASAAIQRAIGSAADDDVRARLQQLLSRVSAAP